MYLQNYLADFLKKLQTFAKNRRTFSIFSMREILFKKIAIFPTVFIEVYTDSDDIFSEFR